MARNRPVDFQGYAVAHVTKEVKKAVKDNLLEAEQALEWICSAAEDGYKFALAYDFANETYQASLYAKDPSSQNAGLMLSLRHVDPVIALTTLRFFHVEIYQGVWPVSESFDW